MIEFKFRILSTWPGVPTPQAKRTRSQFSAKYSQTLELLSRELTHLRARNVVIEADCEPRMIRQDGQLRTDARLNSPGIVLSFESKAGPMRFPCDRFINWDCNLRAIALTLEHLRAVDRYGVTQHSEQYKGWTALEDRRPSAGFDRASAAEFIQAKFRDVLNRPIGISHLLYPSEFREPTFKALKVALHPDRRGSDVEFKQLLEAISALEAANV